MQEFGVGITDRWAAHLIAGYTYDPDINRKGFHLGRLGTTYRIFGNETNFVWDMYGDFHLGGMDVYSFMTPRCAFRGDAPRGGAPAAFIAAV